MGSTSQTAKSIIRNILVLCVLEAVAGFLILSLSGGSYGPGHVAGVTLGSFTSILKIFQLEWSINKTLDKGKKGEKGAGYFRMQYLVRLLMTAAALVIGGLLHPNVNLFSVGLGLLNMSFASYMYRFFHKGDYSNNI